MDGNTWRNYRLITETKDEPPFFLEPNHPPDWPRHFMESGFQSLANYDSSVDEHLDEMKDVQALRAAERMARLGVQLRTLNLAQFESELRTIHRLVTASFQRGFLYQPVSENEFMAQYQAVRPYVRPELVTIATHEDRPVGFSFALPDWLQKQSGRAMDTAIIKTLAILPERRYAGLGSHLVEATRRAARDLGFRRLIHALMHEANPSRAIRADYARVFRRYTLFAKAL
jgi:GNAT superfamily N-acetyltransferase